MVSSPEENGVFLLASDDGGCNTVGSIHVEPIRKVTLPNASTKVSACLSRELCTTFQSFIVVFYWIPCCCLSCRRRLWAGFQPSRSPKGVRNLFFR
jgi:hypothetical protein